MMMHRNVGIFVIALALGGVACDLPPKEVGATLGDTDGESGTSSTSSGGGGQSSTSASATGTTGNPGEGTTSTSTGTTGSPDEGTTSTSTGPAPFDVGVGTSEVGGGEVGEPCDPLLQACADGFGCYLDAGAFTCQIDISGDDSGNAGDACADPAACDPGLVCASCGLADCCVVLCDTGANTCQPDESCVAVYADGDAPLGLETVGLCQ